MLSAVLASSPCSGQVSVADGQTERVKEQLFTNTRRSALVTMVMKCYTNDPYQILCVEP